MKNRESDLLRLLQPIAVFVVLPLLLLGNAPPRQNSQNAQWWSHATSAERQLFVEASTAALTLGYMKAKWYIYETQSHMLHESATGTEQNDPLKVDEGAQFPMYPESLNYYVGLINRAHELGHKEDPLFILLCSSRSLDSNTAKQCYDIQVQLKLRQP